MKFTNEEFRQQTGPTGLLNPDHDWSYRHYTEDERDSIITDLLKRIDTKDFSMVNGDRSRWEKGWGENLHKLMEKGPSGLEPAYIRKDLPLRLNGNFIKPKDPNFERNWYECFRKYLFKTHLAGYDHIYEFGSGSGFNVYLLAAMYPNARITGLDWAHPSIKIINHLRNTQGLNISGRFFDFFDPEYSMTFPENSAVITIGAMEQTGKDWGKFLEFLLVRKPSIVIHSEPIIDLYGDTLPDTLAKKIHTTRNFWIGYIDKLCELQNGNRVQIIKLHRTNFGSLALEGYSQLIWRPLELPLSLNARMG